MGDVEFAVRGLRGLLMLHGVDAGLPLLDSLAAEIERLQHLLDAAVSLHENRDRITWGWNPDSERYGYYLRLKWAGEKMLDVIEAEAAREE